MAEKKGRVPARDTDYAKVPGVVQVVKDIAEFVGNQEGIKTKSHWSIIATLVKEELCELGKLKGTSRSGLGKARATLPEDAVMGDSIVVEVTRGKMRGKVTGNYSRLMPDGQVEVLMPDGSRYFRGWFVAVA